ncbi:MAG: hypothetical protein IKL65_00535 [Bacilli bacterium]|nr:hypothetical protein [Bacilli bacterium]MBR6689803.1 hypothetical protein [Bacilli bacterium]
MFDDSRLLGYKSFSKRLNDRVLTDYYLRLMLIARALFKWENLPNGLDEKWIERYLFSEGACMFYKDPKLGYMVAQIGETGPLNYYDEPTTIFPYATNYLYEGPTLTNNVNAVIIRNNDEMLPTAPTIQLYAYKLTNIERTIDTNILAQKIPTVVKCTDRQRLSFKNAINQRNDNEPVIYSDKGMNTEDITTLDIKAPIVFDKLQIQKHAVWNECMTYLGINNANMDKRERLVDDEVQANNEQVQASEDIFLKARQKACEEINRIFGTNISVKRRNLSKDVLERMESLEKDANDVEVDFE